MKLFPLVHWTRARSIGDGRVCLQCYFENKGCEAKTHFKGDQMSAIAHFKIADWLITIDFRLLIPMKRIFTSKKSRLRIKGWSFCTKFSNEEYTSSVSSCMTVRRLPLCGGKAMFIHLYMDNYCRQDAGSSVFPRGLQSSVRGREGLVATAVER